MEIKRSGWLIPDKLWGEVKVADELYYTKVDDDTHYHLFRMGYTKRKGFDNATMISLTLPFMCIIIGVGL